MTFYILLHGPILCWKHGVANQIREFCFSYDEWHTVSHFRLHDSLYFSLTIINWRISTHLQHFCDHWPLKNSSAGPWCLLQVIAQVNGRSIFSGPRNDRIIICFTYCLIIWFSFSYLYLFFLQAWDRLDGNKVRTKCFMTPSLDWEFELTKQVKPSSFFVLLPCQT